MNYLLQSIMTKISGSTLSSDVGGRIFLDRAPEETEFPYIVFFVVSDVPEYPGGKTMEGILIQFSIFSESQSAVEITGILTDLRALFDDCSLTITGESLVYFIRGNLTTMVDDITTASGASSVKHYAQEYELAVVK